MTQPSLLDAVIREDKPRKRVRAASKSVYTELRDSDRLAQRQHEFLTALAAYYNRLQVWPTLAELTAWAYHTGRIADNNPNVYRPRATELGLGKVKRLKDGTTRRIGGGVIETLPVRVCAESRHKAHPIRIREIGSLERQS